MLNLISHCYVPQRILLFSICCLLSNTKGGLSTDCFLQHLVFGGREADNTVQEHLQILEASWWEAYLSAVSTVICQNSVVPLLLIWAVRNDVSPGNWTGFRQRKKLVVQQATACLSGPNPTSESHKCNSEGEVSVWECWIISSQNKPLRGHPVHSPTQRGEQLPQHPSWQLVHCTF